MEDKTNKITSATEVKRSKANVYLTRDEQYFIGDLIQKEYRQTDDMAILSQCEIVFDKLHLSVFLSDGEEKTTCPRCGTNINNPNSCQECGFDIREE